MPEPYAHDRRTYIDNSTDPISVWYVDYQGSIARIRPLDQSMADDSGSLAFRHCPICFLLVEALNVAQMARGVTRPPDAVRVGWIELDPSRIRLHDRQRELRPRFRL